MPRAGEYPAFLFRLRCRMAAYLPILNTLVPQVGQTP